MNKTLLLIICDFLLLNLLALTRWEKAEPTRPQRSPVPRVSAAAAATKDQDLVDTMRLSLEDERTTRSQLAQQLASAETTLATREQNLAALADEKTRLASTLTATVRPSIFSRASPCDFSSAASCSFWRAASVCLASSSR